MQSLGRQSIKMFTCWREAVMM